MKITIIIPTFNRNEILCKTLSNIIKYEHQYHELILVDQTKKHEEQTQNFLDDLIKDNRIKYLFIDYPNAPNAMNEGIKISSGEIIIFFDDDVEINENTIPSHIAGFSAPDIGCIIGKITIQNIDPSGNIVLKNSSSLKEHLKSIFFFFHKKRASYVGRFGILSNYTGDKILPADSFIGCNSSFRKEVFDKLGFFDINYTGNGVRFETDYSIMMSRNGIRLVYVPGASIIHYMCNTGGTRTASGDAYWRTLFKNQCYFYLKNFKYSKLNIFIIQYFDILRCKRSGLNALSLFYQSYDHAKYLLDKPDDALLNT